MQPQTEGGWLAEHAQPATRESVRNTTNLNTTW